MLVFGISYSYTQASDIGFCRSDLHKQSSHGCILWYFIFCCAIPSMLVFGISYSYTQASDIWLCNSVCGVEITQQTFEQSLDYSRTNDVTDVISSTLKITFDVSFANHLQSINRSSASSQQSCFQNSGKTICVYVKWGLSRSIAFCVHIFQLLEWLACWNWHMILKWISTRLLLGLQDHAAETQDTVTKCVCVCVSKCAWGSSSRSTQETTVIGKT